MLFQRAVQGKNLIICDYDKQGTGINVSSHRDCINKQYLIILAV